jgi:predicted CxxxxCH...CXXCH cytochrome family protein
MTGHMDGVVQANAHGTAWMDQASAGFHASSANQGLASCQGCHGQTLAGQGSAPSCASCHDKTSATGTVAWATHCTMCHGGTDDQSGAPPKATWGNAADAVRVGAHTAHSRGGALAPAYDCAVCHVKPADAFAAGHLDGPTATVTFGGMAVRGLTPTWDRTTGTCTNVYCHGSTVAGGTNKAPSWTAGSSQAACGTCHGAPPPAPHPAAAGLTACVACHPTTVAADGTVIPPAQGGTHLDGVLQSSGGHPASWIDQTSPGFHAYAADANLGACQNCHGPNLDGVGGSATTSCATCHGAGWRTSCTMCHGGTDNPTGAPPRTTWGNSADAVRVGAHSRHLAGSANAPPVACAACHVVPSDALSPGHVDGSTATVTFGGVATAGGVAPSWNRSTATCATTYCHGSYSGTFTFMFWGTPDWVNYSGSGAAPSWTGGPMTCTSCHGAPPLNGQWHQPTHGVAGGSACSLCHPGVNAAGTGFTDPSRHVDGNVDVTPAWDSTCNDCH